ncbi:MAG: chemotaxis protein CheD [Butyribacter sp.]|nr:chemotaxis protein CheD [bacterium]MDY3853754.1 chemotaxis protein CheD [Butyribacter sp.]
MEEVVGIADMKIIKGEGVLATYALGSCVGICLYDEVTKIGGLLHAMLPDSSMAQPLINPQKYVDTGIEQLYRTMCHMGAVPGFLRAKIIGGAKMFEYKTSMEVADIGTANVVKAKHCLAALGIPIISELTGGEVGRTIRFNPVNKDVIVHSTDGKIEVI